jgi:hypothetical protein
MLESLCHGAWPYIDRANLDLRGAVGGGSGEALVNMFKWPRCSKTRRPMLLHMAKLQYHYGAQIASNRESEIRFEALGGAALGSPSGIAEFMPELFDKLWIP